MVGAPFVDMLFEEQCVCTSSNLKLMFKIDKKNSNCYLNSGGKWKELTLN